MLLIADALTVVYLRPYLIANGYSEADVRRIHVWYDPSLIATRNDRASDADMGFDKMAVSFDTWRRAHGFSDNDAPTPQELGLRLILSKGMITPELTEGMLAAVSPEIMDLVRATSQASSPAPMPSDISQMLSGSEMGQVAPIQQSGAPAPTPPPAQPPVPLAEPEV